MKQQDESETLSVGGVRVLRGEAPRGGAEAGVVVQVLRVARHLVDPTLQRLLRASGHAGDARDVFDVVLSDGRQKTKCLLAPALNAAVWRGRISPLDIIWISDFEVLSVVDADGASSRPVCLVSAFETVTQQIDKFLVTTATSTGKQQQQRQLHKQVEKASGDDIAFVSSASERETGLLPVAGERRYYLPLSSDQYPLEWEVSGPPTSARQVCANPFASTGKIHSIQEIHELIEEDLQRSESGAWSRSYPPLIGVVRAKSKATHFGEPGIANPLPFMFHLIVGDSDSVAEIAFFGSMCAKYFGAIEEGDLIQLCGYSATPDPSKRSSGSSLLFFEHESAGEVFHVSEKHWKLLQTLRVVPEPACASGVRDDNDRTPPIWFERSFGSTLDAQYASETVENPTAASAYFDFVGVLSFVGQICRSRKRKRVASEDAEGEDGAVIQYRWLKAVDRSSSVEMAILLHDCSNPTRFRSLKAGDFVVLTKLKWVAENGDPSTFCMNLSQVSAAVVDDHVFGAEYAVCSAFSVLRANDATAGFDGIEDCSLNKFFAAKLVANSSVCTNEASGESWLEGETIAQYEALPNVVVDSEASVADYLARKTYPFSDLLKIVQRLETMEHLHIGVTGYLTLIPKAPSKAERLSPLAYGIEFGDARRSRRATLRLNPVFHILGGATAARHRIKNASPGAFDGLFSTLAPSIVDELVEEAHREQQSPIAAAAGDDNDNRESRSLTRVFIEHHLVHSKRVFLFSTHLHRSAQGKVAVEVDAILPFPSST